jgi:hypothetical protein
MPSTGGCRLSKDANDTSVWPALYAGIAPLPAKRWGSTPSCVFNTPIILATALSATPPLARAEVEHGPDSTHVLAFDTNEDVAAEVVVWHVDHRHIRIDALFPDGLTLSAQVAVSGDVVSIDSDDPQVVAGRLSAVDDLLAGGLADGALEGSWLKCAAYAAITAFELAHASPIAVPTAILAACECLPEIVDEWEGLECF